MGSFLIRDTQGRLYPSQAKRLAPDFFFQPQIYRADGEFVLLPAGQYSVVYTRGPEYRKKTQQIEVKDQPMELIFRLDRWIDPAKLGWYSGDHHIHAAGCAHYEKPTEGVYPKDMMRHILGEDLKIGSVLSWGPSWYFQKTFFEGKDNALSTKDNVMRYDVEVSGFPSSHTGHICLLGLKEEDFPGTKRIEEWPSWGLPIFRWAKAQGAVTGFAHSGWGLAVKTEKLLTDEIPPFDGIGANEYIVGVTHDLVDFISTVDTPYAWELNIWYHTLNVGYRTRISGETDFPCIYGERVGLGRSYVRQTSKLDYDDWAKGIREGRTYVSDGKSHLIDFRREWRGGGLKRQRAADVRARRGARHRAGGGIARGHAGRKHPQAGLRSETVLGSGAIAHREYAHGSSGTGGKRSGGGSTGNCSRWRAPANNVRLQARSQQLDRAPDSAVLTHQSDLRPRWWQSDPLETKRRVVPARRRSVLAPEGDADPDCRKRRGAARVRFCSRRVPAASARKPMISF